MKAVDYYEIIRQAMAKEGTIGQEERRFLAQLFRSDVGKLVLRELAVRRDALETHLLGMDPSADNFLTDYATRRGIYLGFSQALQTLVFLSQEKE